MKPALLIIVTLALFSCGERDRQLANSFATIYEAAEAIKQGKDTTGPVIVIQANAVAGAAALDHPYPPPKETP